MVGVILVLVMLFLFFVESNRECVEDVINMFLVLNDEYLFVSIYCYCVLLFLDFCKFLVKSVFNYVLYVFC